MSEDREADELAVLARFIKVSLEKTLDLDRPSMMTVLTIAMGMIISESFSTPETLEDAYKTADRLLREAVRRVQEMRKKRQH